MEGQRAAEVHEAGWAAHGKALKAALAHGRYAEASLGFSFVKSGVGQGSMAYPRREARTQILEPTSANLELDKVAWPTREGRLAHESLNQSNLEFLNLESASWTNVRRCCELRIGKDFGASDKGCRQGQVGHCRLYSLMLSGIDI